MIDTLKDYLKHHNVNKTAFARQIGISKQHFHRILKTGKYSKEVGLKLKNVIQLQEHQQKLEELQNQIHLLSEALEKDLKALFEFSKDRYCEYSHFSSKSQLREFCKLIRDQKSS